MAFDLPFGFRFDPTNDELIYGLQWKLEDLNDPRIAFISNIVMGVHEPSEFDGLCTVKGKDGIMYFFAEWDRYGKGGRLDRQVKKDSMKARWKEWSSETIKSSDGTQIGTRKNLTFQVDGSLTEWHMEEYRLCRPEHEHSKVSICRVSKKCSQARCRVSKKCSQARRTTKIDAKVDNVDHLCQPLKEKRKIGKKEAGQRKKSKKEAGQSCISDTGNGPERETLDMDSGKEINEGQKDGGPPSWCGLCSAWHTPKETCRNLYEMSPPLNVDNLVTTNWVYSLDDNFHNRPNPAEDYVDNPDTRNCQIADDTIPMDMDDATKMGNCQLEPLGFVPLEGFEALGFLFPDHSYAICSNAAEGYIDNPDTGNCQSANDTVLDMNDVTEMIDNPDTGNCQSANDTILDMNDVTEMVDNLVTTNWDFSLDDNFHNQSNPAEEYVLCWGQCSVSL